MGKSLKWNSHRSTAFRSGKSSSCWNKDKLSDCIHTSNIGCETNYNKKTPCAICWAFTCLALGDAVCMCYPHNKPAQFHPVYRWRNWDSAVSRNFLRGGGFTSNHVPGLFSFYDAKWNAGLQQLHPSSILSFSFFLFNKYSGNSKWLFNSILSHFLYMLSDAFPSDCELHQSGIWCPFRVCGVSDLQCQSHEGVW